jgi:hypothetical protein
MCLLMYAADSNGEDSITMADDLKKLNEELDKALD